MGHGMAGIGYPVSRMHQTPRTTAVDTTEVRQHIARLESVGMSIAMIARAAGMTDTQVSFYKAGQPTTRASYAAAVLSVDGRPSKHQAFVLRHGTVRRLEGLAVMGYTQSEVGAATGMSFSAVSRVRRTQGYVTWEMHSRVRDAFDSLGFRGSSDRVRRMALRRGWVHPFDWVDIDDPFESPVTVEDSGLPDPVVVERLVAGRPTDATPEERKAAFIRLRESGLSTNAAADMAHISFRTAERYSNLVKGVAA